MTIPNSDALNDEILLGLKRFNKAKIRDQNINSPVDINPEEACKIHLRKLQFINYEKEPIKLKVTNTGKTVIVSGKWKLNEHPYITGGPLEGEYFFSMLVFHWGAKCKSGSFHTVEKERQAMEIHIVHFKSTYLRLEEAAKHDDGVAIVSYLCELRFQVNLNLEPILLALDKISLANSSIYIDNFLLKNLVPAFEKDYFTYSAKLTVHFCFRNVVWLIPRQFLPVSFYQIKTFGQLLTKQLLPIKGTTAFLHDSPLKPTLFLVNSSYPCPSIPFHK